jgi:AraC family transcriptional activator of tynA and feaB
VSASPFPAPAARAMPLAVTGGPLMPLMPLTPLMRAEMPLELVGPRLQAVCGNFAAVPMPRQHTVSGGIEVRRAGGVDFALIGQNLQRVYRDARAIRGDDREHFFLVFQDHGGALMCQGEQRVAVQAGDIVLIDSARPSEFVYDGACSQQVSVHLPRADMLARFGPALQGGVCVRRGDALGFAMRAILARMLESGQSDDAHLVEAFLGVFGSVLVERARQVPALARSAGEGVLRKALGHVALHFQDPAFHAGDLARHLGVSPRLLQRAFESLGVSPSRHILDARLAAAHASLQAAAKRGAPAVAVSVVAYDCGFNDLSFFHREFRKRFGVPPGQLGRVEPDPPLH